MSNIEAAVKPVALSPSSARDAEVVPERDDRTFPVTDRHQGVRGRAIVKKLAELGLIRPVDAEDGVASDEATISALRLDRGRRPRHSACQLSPMPMSRQRPPSLRMSPSGEVVSPPASGALSMHRARGPSCMRSCAAERLGQRADRGDHGEDRLAGAHQPRRALRLRKRGYHLPTSRSADNRALYRIISERG